MHKGNENKLESTETSILTLPKQSPLRIKWQQSQQLPSTPRSFTQNILSNPSQTSTPYIRRSQSFYNDRKCIFKERSRILSQKSTSFQNKSLSLSIRKRYQSERTEQIIEKRSIMRNTQQSSDIKKESKSMAIQRFHDISENKYKKLLYGQHVMKVNKAMLQKGIRRNLSEKPGKRWSSPFNEQQNKPGRKPFTSKQILPLLTPSNPTQIKVLNLDRLFRMRDGKLTNVVPLPVAKLSQVNSRKYLLKAVKHEDKIHQALQQYNNLLKMSQLSKTVPKLGVKGKTFTKTPTIEQLMGLKFKPSKTNLKLPSHHLGLQIFTQHCKYFQRCVKQDIHLSRRILSGLTRMQPEGSLSLQVFTLFWQLFISKAAKLEEKAEFLVYFFLPNGQEKVELQLIRLILQLMCKDLPPIEKLNFHTDLLSGQQKSKIFLEALIRVLFGDITLDKGKGMDRNALSQILNNNPDACDLLIKLLQADQ